MRASTLRDFAETGQGIEVPPEAFRSATQEWSVGARKYGKPGFCESKNGPKKYKTGMAFDEKDGF